MIRTSIKKSCVALLTVGLLGCASPPPEMPVASAQAVGGAFQAWIAGWTGADVEAVVGPFTEDAVVYDPAGSFAGSEGVRNWAEQTFSAMDGITISIVDASVNVTGPTAWITGAYEWTATLEGEEEPFTERGNLSMLWILQEDGSYASPLFHASQGTATAESGPDGG